MSVESFEQTPVGKFDSAMSALIGHLLAEFLVSSCAVVGVSTLDRSSDTEVRSMVMTAMFLPFTFATLATYAINLAPLWFLAGVRKSIHAFWISALATGATAFSLLTCILTPLGHFWLVGLLHVVVFTITCGLYAAAMSVVEQNRTANTR
jgi:hypothetical protein